MENEERKDINSIMDKLLRKQQELAQRQAPKAEAVQQPASSDADAEKANDEVRDSFSDVFGDDSAVAETEDEAAKTQSEQEVTVEEEQAQPEGNVVEEILFNDAQAAPEEAAKEETPAINENLYNSILDDVMSSNFANEDDETIARRVQELYSEYVSSTKSDAPEEEADSASNDAADALIDDYFTPVNEEKEEQEPQKTEDEPQAEEAEGEDDLLLAALGYTDGKNVNVKKPEKEKRQLGGKFESDLDSAYAYNGKEYKSRSQKGEILGAFDKAGRYMWARIIGTSVFFVLLLIFDALGNKFGGPLNAATYPVVNVMISLQLLVLCAAFSYRKLYEGLVGLVKAHPVPSSVTLIVLAVTFVYDVLVAIFADGTAFTLYNAPAALSLLIQVLSDALKLGCEKRNFEKLSGFESVSALEKTEENGVFRLRRAEIASGFFRRTNRYNGAYAAANYIIVPVIAVGIILMLVSLVAGRGFINSMNILVTFIQFAMPVFAVAAIDMPFRLKTLGHTSESTVIFNENDVADYGRIKKLILDETDMFGDNSLGILGFKNMPGFELFDDVAAASAICDKVGGTISKAFSRVGSETADMLPVAVDSVRIIRVTDGGIEAEYNNRHYVLGSVRFLAENGIACPGSNDKAYMTARPGTVVFHIATDGVETSRFTIVYQADPGFVDFADELSRRGIQIELRCLDPNLSHEFIASLLGKNGPEINVVREEKSEFDTEEDNYSLESGLVAEGDATLDLIDTAEYCGRFARISAFNRKLTAGMILALALIGILLGAIGIFNGLSSLIIVAVYLVCLFPSMVLTKLI